MLGGCLKEKDIFLLLAAKSRAFASNYHAWTAEFSDHTL